MDPFWITSDELARLLRPGRCVAGLAVYAVIFTVQPPESTLGKVLMVVGAFGLMLLEMWAIGRDRAALDQQSDERFAAILHQFALLQAEMARQNAAQAEANKYPVGDPRREPYDVQVASSADAIAAILHEPPVPIMQPPIGPFQFMPQRPGMP